MSSAVSSFSPPAPSRSRGATSRPPFPVRRRITVCFTGGVEGVLTLSAALHHGDHKVHDLTVDIRDGVAESSAVCTVMTAERDVDPLLERLRALSAVISAELL